MTPLPRGPTAKSGDWTAGLIVLSGPVWEQMGYHGNTWAVNATQKSRAWNSQASSALRAFALKEWFAQAFSAAPAPSPKAGRGKLGTRGNTFPARNTPRY